MFPFDGFQQCTDFLESELLSGMDYKIIDDIDSHIGSDFESLSIGPEIYLFPTGNMEPFGCYTCGKQFHNCADLERHEFCEEKAYPEFNEIIQGAGEVVDQRVRSDQPGLHEHVIIPPNEGLESIAEESSNSDSSKGHSSPSRTRKDRQHDCRICFKRFSRKSNFNAHLKVHDDNCSLYDCYVCGKKFRRKSNLSQHMLIHGGENDRPYECTICRKRFRRKSHLNEHAALHNEKDVSFECDICKRTFKRESNLTNHLIIHHSNDRPYECKVCMTAFKRKSNLNEHSIIHNVNDRPYQCNICRQTFKRKSHLTNHLSVHDDHDRPFECTVCGRRFKLAENLNHHMGFHDGSRPKRRRRPVSKTEDGDHCRRRIAEKNQMIFWN